MSKQKGNKFETKIMKDLRKIFKYTYRVIGSGAGENKGDVMFKNYLIECKHYRKLTHSQIIKFWNDIAIEAAGENKQPILIWKENYIPEKVMFLLNDKYLVTMLYNEWKKYVMENK